MGENQQDKEKKGNGNPLLGFLDQVLVGARKFLAEQKMLKFAEELAYLSLRKTIDMLSNTFVPIKIDGKEKLPEFKAGILCSIVDQPIDLAIALSLTPRRVHLMLPAKMYSTPGLKPLFETYGAFRSTVSKDDMEPIQNVMKYIKEEQEFVAMIPIDEGDPVKLEKSFAGILKFAAGIGCLVIPYASTSLKNFRLGDTIEVKVGDPIEVKTNIKREERYAMARDLMDKILAMKQELQQPPE